jgi:hypothetical protein
MHRLIWDLRYTQPAFSSPLSQGVQYSMSVAAGQNSAHEPEGPYALPGNYQARLMVNGKSYSQLFKLVMDPRVHTAPADLEKQFALGMRLTAALARADQALAAIHHLYKSNSAGDSLNQLATIEPAPNAQSRGKTSLSSVAGNLGQLLVAIESVDAAPTSTQTSASEENLKQIDQLLRQWQTIQGK